MTSTVRNDSRIKTNGRNEEEHVEVSIYLLQESPENSKIYKPPTEDDPATIALAESIREKGILEPLVISADNYIISGHRRHKAAEMAELETVPCRRLLNVKRGDGKEASDEYLKLLPEYNRQRKKSYDELLREAVLDINPDDAYSELTKFRRKKAKTKVEAIEIRERGLRFRPPAERCWTRC
jgi:ParB-like nuclease domain